MKVMSVLGSPILLTLLSSDSQPTRMPVTTVSQPLQDACRLCLQVHADNVDIFGDVAQKQSLAQKVWKHLSVWVTQEDSLPKTICQQCIKEVENFSEYYTKVEGVQNVIHVRIPETPKEFSEKPESNLSEPNNLSIKVECNPVVDDDIKESSTNVESDYEENIKPEVVQRKSPVDTIQSIFAESEELIVPDIHNNNIDHCGRPDLEMEKQCENYSDTNSDAADVIPERNSEPDVILINNSSEDEDMIMYDLASFYKLSCEFCQNKETFETFELLQKHCLDEHNTRAFVICCSRKLSAKDSLRKHMRRHLSRHIKPFKCQLCNKQLSTKWSLNIHMLTRHTPVEKLPFRCRKCPKAFVTRSDFAKHESLHLQKEEMSSYICEICGKKYASSSGLHAHKLYQHTQHSMLCHMCPRFFYSSSMLQKHLQSHQPDKDDEREQCKKCGKTLKNKDTMRSHMKLHEEDSKAFPCSQCDRIFKIASRLKAHQRSHSNERPHKCDICNKSFKKKFVLKEHMTQHTGERPHQCPHCPRTFACLSNYYTHKRKMHSSSSSPVETKAEINPNLYH